MITRGGGSLEDLWAFNEEALARAIHAFPLPVISAVGHEIDFTIADFVADLRAPTPSAAAELLVPDRRSLDQRISELAQSLGRRAKRALDEWESHLEQMGRSSLLREPARVLDAHEQELDYLVEQLRSKVEGRLLSFESDLHRREHALAVLHPEHLLDRQSQRLALLEEKMTSLTERRIGGCEQLTERAAASLRSLGPDSVLARGFSVTLDAGGKLVSSKEDVSKGDRLRTKLADGEIESVVD